MRKILLFFLTFLLLSIALVGCGGGGGSNPPPAQPQITSFAFLQQTSAQSAYTTPMLGKFSVLNNDVQFSAAAAATDSSTGKPVSGDLGSIALSADGKKAVVDMYGGTEQAPSNQWDIWVANVSGSNVTLVQVTNDAYEEALPQFSPDGSKVIFMSDQPLNGGPYQWQVFIKNADGTGPEQTLPLPAGMMWAGQPTYSPNGRTIALAASSATTYTQGIFLVNADGTNPHFLTSPYSSTCSCVDELPAFSADGSKIFFSRYNWTSTSEFEAVYVVNADGSNASNPVKLTDGVGIDYDPMSLNVAGLGERVLFCSNRSNPADATYASFEMYSMKTDGTAITRLTSNTLYDGFSLEWYGDSAGAAAQRVKAQPRLIHPPVYPTLRPDWR